VVVISCVAACGRIAFDPRNDASASTGDGPTFVAPCNGTVLLDDDFNVAGPAPAFALSQQPASIVTTESNGELLFDLTGPISGPGYRTYYSSATYPLDGICVVVEATRIVSCRACGSYIKIWDTSHAAEFWVAGDPTPTLAMRTHINAVGGGGDINREIEVAFDPTTTRLWQFRQLGDQTLWATSGDGVSFVLQTQVAGLFTEASVTFALGAGASVATSNGGAAGFGRATLYGP
jgi:hypothetical protein